MKSLAVIVSLLALYHLSSSAQIHDCGSQSGKVSSVTIGNCPAATARCTFKPDEQESIEIAFTPSEDSDSATIQLTGIIGGAPIPFQKIDACKEGGLTCPLKSGSSQTVKVAMKTPNLYHGSFDVRIELKDASGKDFLCQQFPAQIP